MSRRAVISTLILLPVLTGTVVIAAFRDDSTIESTEVIHNPGDTTPAEIDTSEALSESTQGFTLPEIESSPAPSQSTPDSSGAREETQNDPIVIESEEAASTPMFAHAAHESQNDGGATPRIPEFSRQTIYAGGGARGGSGPSGGSGRGDDGAQRNDSDDGDGDEGEGKPIEESPGDVSEPVDAVDEGDDEPAGEPGKGPKAGGQEPKTPTDSNSTDSTSGETGGKGSTNPPKNPPGDETNDETNSETGNEGGEAPVLPENPQEPSDPILADVPTKPVQVPEPATFALLGLGLLGCATARRRRAK